MTDEFGNDLVEEEPVFAPPPVNIPRQWSFNTTTLLWSAGGVAAAGFIIWFLMAYTGAKARALAEEIASNGE